MRQSKVHENLIVVSKQDFSKQNVFKNKSDAENKIRSLEQSNEYLKKMKKK